MAESTIDPEYDVRQRRKSARKTAIVLALAAVGVYLLFVFGGMAVR